MASRVLRAGLVGYGFAGQTFHAPVLSAVPGTGTGRGGQFPARSGERRLAGRRGRAGYRRAGGSRRYRSGVVATPNAQHHPAARAALEAGKHVVVDKPFTLDASEARELAMLARRGGQAPVGLPEPSLRFGFPDLAGGPGQRADRPAGVPRIAFRPLQARGARALARAARAGRGAVGRPGRAPARSGRAIVRPARDAAARLRTVARRRVDRRLLPRRAAL